MAYARDLFGGEAEKGPFWILLIIERTGLADGLDVEGEGVKGVNLQIFGWIK